ncbi:DNA mismatch repair protein MSH4 [Linum grandiflorum]
MRLFAGANPVRVMASGAVDVNHKDEIYDGKVPDIIDNAYVIVEFDNGSRGMLDLCMFAEGSKNEQEISVVGDIGKGEAFVPESIVRVGGRVAGRDGVKTSKAEDDRIIYDGLHHGSSYLEHLNFLSAVRAEGEKVAAVDLQDGLISVAIGVAAQRSIEEGRFVGMAAFNMRSAALDLSQYIETSISYHNTKTLLQFYDPVVVIVPPNKLAADGMVGVSELVDKYYAPIRKVVMARGCFDDTRGAVLVKSLAAQVPSALGLETYYKQYYLCLAAASAIIKWIEAEKGVIVTNHSLSVTFNGSFDHMNIDATSVHNLELIDPLHSSLLGTTNKKKSLFHMLKTTKTIGGTRLLRANLLQPLKDIETINTRLNCLDELMSNEQLFFGLTQVLRKFPKETDRVLCHFCFKPKKVTNEVMGVDNARKSQVLISSIILLKTTLEALPLLGKVLKDANCVLLSNIYRTVCENEKYSTMRKRIGEVIDEDVLHARVPFIARTQQCFAVKAGIDGLLDIARRTFCDTSEGFLMLGLFGSFLSIFLFIILLLFIVSFFLFLFMLFRFPDMAGQLYTTLQTSIVKNSNCQI